MLPALRSSFDLLAVMDAQIVQSQENLAAGILDQSRHEPDQDLGVHLLGIGSLWLNKMRERRRPNVVAVARANKNARIVWAMLAGDKAYEPERSTSAAREDKAGEPYWARHTT
jgi:hypothetical protein